MRAGTEMVGVLHGILHEPHGGRLLLPECLFHCFGQRSQRLVSLGFGNVLAHHLEECLHCGAALLRELAAAQVHRLHTVGAFVDLGDTGIAHELAHAPFLDVAVTTEDLLHVGRDFIALVGAVALDDRGQQPDQHVGLLTFFFGCSLVAEVDLQRAPQAQCAHAFGEGLGIHQHATNIGVHEDRVGLLFGLCRTGQGAALAPIERIGHCVLVSHFGLAEALDPHAETRGVHHDEHGGKTLVLLADEPALRAIVIEHAGGIAVNAHLVFDRTADNAVALADRTVFLDEELGHNEQ